MHFALSEVGQCSTALEVALPENPEHLKEVWWGLGLSMSFPLTHMTGLNPKTPFCKGEEIAGINLLLTLVLPLPV